MLAACQMIIGLLQNQKLSMDEHTQVQKAFVMISPKCVEEIQKEQKKEGKK